MSARRAHRHIVLLLSFLALALAGCGEEERGTTSYTPQPTPSPAVTEAATATPSATAQSPEDQPGGAGDEQPIVHAAALTIGEEGFEPPELPVPAFFALRLTIHNRTAAEHTVTVAGWPPLTVGAGQDGAATIEGLAEGRHRVTLARAPFEATLVADPDVAPRR